VPAPDPVSAPEVQQSRSGPEAVSAVARRLMQVASILQAVRRPCSDSRDVPALVVPVSAPAVQRSWFESAAVSAGARRLLEAATIPQVARRPCSDRQHAPEPAQVVVVSVPAVAAQRPWFGPVAVPAGA